ncbi:unnamed protein product [Didymodactylos carnosus]|uniref:Large ribosomal subunit protein mL64 n=1 Tax=Didymodactylos carnosus TaxID=1234261 RepID=A0A815EUL5_9BILA|nr:unnamed protein product [Didymodactylos carnosus]CAF1317017.1 unnamed protein product [Didymodactylos carnosus]CAF3555614.1 unnamed protein product [Didymodactylos carnosus]CAF4159831.1 unnamed protein product [Didymodactylos carnosus]
MFCILKEIRCPNCTKINHIISNRFVSSTTTNTPSNATPSQTIATVDTNVSRLPADVYRVFKGLPPLELLERNFTREKLRSVYGRYGKKSGIDVKLSWPTQEEMDEIIQDEKLYNMELKEKIRIVKERKEAKQKEIDQIQAKVEKNLKNMPKMIADYQTRAAQKELAMKAESKVKSDLARDYYGFAVDPNDERMQMMLLQIEEKQKLEEKKQRKVLKTQQAAQKLQELMGVSGEPKEISSAAEGETPTSAIDTKEQETDMKLFAQLLQQKSKLAKAASKMADEQVATATGAKGKKK